jgi:hypothetical protein
VRIALTNFLRQLDAVKIAGQSLGENEIDRSALGVEVARVEVQGETAWWTRCCAAGFGWDAPGTRAML